MDKQKYSIRVAGKNYTLVSSDEPDYVRRVAELADRRLNEMSVLTNQSPAAAAVLTCINLADELLKAQDENNLLRQRMEEALKNRKEEAEQ